jgi:hypothetical protein
MELMMPQDTEFEEGNTSRGPMDCISEEKVAHDGASTPAHWSKLYLMSAFVFFIAIGSIGTKGYKLHFGPAFNSDNAGDGPDNDNDETSSEEEHAELTCSLCNSSVAFVSKYRYIQHLNARHRGACMDGLLIQGTQMFNCTHCGLCCLGMPGFVGLRHTGILEKLQPGRCPQGSRGQRESQRKSKPS